jgi:NADH-quinone oxidoreductase subunit L
MENAWIIPLFPLGAFVALALFRRFLPGQGNWLAVAAVVAAFLAAWPVLFDLVGRGVGPYHFPREWFSAGPLSMGWGTLVDPLTVAMLLLVTFVSVLVQVYSLGYMRHEVKGRRGSHVADDPRIGWYYAAHSLFTASMLTLVLADNLILLYVAWELVGLCSYLLIGFWYERPSAVGAAKKAFITTRIGDVGLLIGIALLVAHTGTFDISANLEMVEHGELSSGITTLVALLLFAGAVGKSAQFPLFVWLPDAMEGPTPVSALIHAATMVTAGVFLVARLLPLYEASEAARLTVASVGLLSGLMGASMALAATDLKRILAFSTMSHLGFMFLALGAGGYTAATFHLLTHGVSKAMLFLAAGSVMHALHDETDIRRMGGLARRMPVTGTAFVLGALALSGVPPLAAFWSKDEILVAVANGLNPVFLVGFLIAIVLSALYMARAVRVAFFGEHRADAAHAHESGWVMKGPLALLAVCTVLVGLVALPLGFDGVGSFLFDAAHGPHAFKADPVWMPVGIVLALAGLGLGWWLYDRAPGRVEALRSRFGALARLLENRYYLDPAYQWLVDRVVLAAGRVIAVFDRRWVNDVGMDGPGVATLAVGTRLRMHVSGFFADYGLAVAAGAVALAVLLWLGA